MRAEGCGFLPKVEQHIARVNSHEDRETGLLHNSKNTQQKVLDVHVLDPEEDESTYTMEGAHQTRIIIPHVEWTKAFAREGAPEPEPKKPASRRRDTNDENPTKTDMDDQAPGDARSETKSCSSVQHSQRSCPRRSPRTPQIGKRRTLVNSPDTRFPRRSPRLTTTPTKAFVYPDLYHELKLMVWDCVKEQEARVVYIRNSSVSTFEPVVQTPPPIWPEIDESSEQVANLAYLQMFVVCGPDGRPDDRTRQVVNPSVDVIVLEPCNGECRGGNCVRSQYSAADRAKVRFLAVGVSWAFVFPSRPRFVSSGDNCRIGSSIEISICIFSIKILYQALWEKENAFSSFFSFSLFFPPDK